MNDSWQSYEEVAAFLLNKFSEEFDLERVEGKQKVVGKRSGTEWEIDAKGVKEGDEGFVIVECRKYLTSKQNQEKVGALAYRIIDSGAKGGIIVSPLGFQSGAKKVANSENIIEVHLDANSTPHEFSLKFLNILMVGLHEFVGVTESVIATISRPCIRCGEQFTVKENKNLCQKCNAS